MKNDTPFYKPHFRENFELLSELSDERKNNGAPPNVISIDRKITYRKSGDQWAVYYWISNNVWCSDPVVGSFGSLRPITQDRMSWVLGCKVKRLHWHRFKLIASFMNEEKNLQYICWFSYNGSGNMMIQMEKNKNGYWVITKYFPNAQDLNRYILEPDKLLAIVPADKYSKGSTANEELEIYHAPKRNNKIPNAATLPKLKRLAQGRIKQLKGKYSVNVMFNKEHRDEYIRAAEALRPVLTNDETISVDNETVMNFIQKGGLTNNDIMDYVNKNDIDINIDDFFDEDD